MLQTRAVNTFLTNIEIPAATGEAYNQAIEAYNQAIRDELAKLNPSGIGVSACFDGAASNMGAEKGLAAKLRLDAWHCGGHRSHLTVGHVKRDHQRFAELVEVLRTVAKDLWTSPKKA